MGLYLNPGNEGRLHGGFIMEEKIMQLANMLKESNSIVFFGGAGISTASGIPDFRSSDGLYSKKLNKHFTPEQAVSHTFLVKYPEEFYEFYILIGLLAIICIVSYYVHRLKEIGMSINDFI